MTNAPPVIPHLATTSDLETMSSSSMAALRRPQLCVGPYPELAFVLLSPPVGDPLLSRICVDPDSLGPTQYEAGWALADDIRNAWIALENGLVYISDLLLSFPEQSSCGTSATYAIRSQGHWPHPEDYGYRKPHKTAWAAQKSIRRAHQAFQLLIARCSLSLALWIFPGPRAGHVPLVQTTHYDYATNESLPDWVAFLLKKKVPSSWINALGDSVISDFSPNLRVGTVFDLKNPALLPITHVLRAANVPVFVMWQNLDQTKSCVAKLPFMALFTPASPRDAQIALQHRPGGRPRILTLCRDGRTRPYPNFAAVDDVTPPFGPYQHPAESRLDFFAQRERYRPDQTRQETQQQIDRRRDRTAHAESGLPPFRRSRVYLWVSARILFPDLPARWQGCEYRKPIPPSAYRTLWMVHPAGYRQYNPYFDEWDMWFPPDWGVSLLSPSQNARVDAPSNEDQSILDAAQPRPRAVSMTGRSVTETEKLIRELSADALLLIADPDSDMKGEDDFNAVALPSADLLGSWYGISITDTRTFPEVDYKAWVERLPQIFSEQAANIPEDNEYRTLVAGWISAMLAGDLRSRALMHTWDLDSRNASFLLRDGQVQSCISLEHIGAPTYVEDEDNIVRWVCILFHRDPDDHPWSLITTSMGALWLARRLAEADTSSEAVMALVAVGVPVRTGRLLKHPVPPTPTATTTSRSRMVPLWQKVNDPSTDRPTARPTVQDYDSYCQRVLELGALPHARAAWLKGGIVWRIMREVTGRETHKAYQGVDGDGPSEECTHHRPVTVDIRVRAEDKEEDIASANPADVGNASDKEDAPTTGEAFYDDALTLEELDIIAGIVKVYTGTHGDCTAVVRTNPGCSCQVFEPRRRTPRGGPNTPHGSGQEDIQGSGPRGRNIGSRNG